MNPIKPLLAPLFAVAGVLHFTHPEPFDGVVPKQLPGSPRFYTYASGVAELACAALIANRATRPLGGLLSVALLAAVWPANGVHAYKSRKTPGLREVTLARLPLQIPLMRAAWSIAAEPARRSRR